MKKILLSLLLVLPFCSFAQKGMQGIGGGFGIGKCSDFDCTIMNYSLRYQYNLTNHIRIVQHMEYIYADEYEYQAERVINCGISAHYFLTNVRRLRPYIISGFSLGYLDYDDYDDTYHSKEEDGLLYFDVEIGIGLDYRIGYNCSMQIELLGHISSLLDPIYFGPNIGLTYTF